MVSRLTASSPAHPWRYASTLARSSASIATTCDASVRLCDTPLAASAATTCSAEANSSSAFAPPTGFEPTTVPNARVRAFSAAASADPRPNSRRYNARNRHACDSAAATARNPNPPGRSNARTDRSAAATPPSPAETPAGRCSSECIAHTTSYRRSGETANAVPAAASSPRATYPSAADSDANAAAYSRAVAQRKPPRTNGGASDAEAARSAEGDVSRRSTRNTIASVDEKTVRAFCGSASSVSPSSSSSRSITPASPNPVPKSWNASSAPDAASAARNAPAPHPTSKMVTSRRPSARATSATRASASRQSRPATMAAYSSATAATNSGWSVSRRARGTFASAAASATDGEGLVSRD